jgi:hypothetical protein
VPNGSPPSPKKAELSSIHGKRVLESVKFMTELKSLLVWATYSNFLLSRNKIRIGDPLH